MRSTLLFVAFLATCYVASGALLGIDFGSELIKMSLVVPGKAFHIVMDDHSKRKIPNLVAFDGSERFFGTGAVNIASKKPKHGYVNMQWLLGRSPSSPEVQRFKDEGYPLTFVPIEDRGTVGLQHNEETVFTPELIVSMILQNLKSLAEKDAQQETKDVVITVPSSWSQKERQALIDAATLAGFNVLSLLNQNAAAAVQYGIDFDFKPEEVYNVVFYNMGSTGTEVSLVQYSSTIKRQGKQNKTIGQFEIKGTTFDDSLGGQAFDFIITDYIADQLQTIVNKQMGADAPNIRAVPRSMAKIRSAAKKAKEVLSANTETGITIESAYQEIDLRSQLTREEFYKKSQKLFARVTAPVKELFELTGISGKDLYSFVVIGGSTRIPQVEKVLKEFLKGEGYAQELGKNIDADEAMAMGAAFFAANSSTQFRVRPLGMSDVSLHAVGVRFSDLPGYVLPTTSVETEAVEKEGEEAEEKGSDKASKPKKFTKRAALYKRFNFVSKKKSVVFSHERDFQCTMHHDDVPFLPKGVTAQIAVYNITGVSNASANPEFARLLASQKPKVSLSFLLSSSGIVDLVKAEATLEETVEVKVPKKKVKPAQNATATVNATSSESSEESKPSESSKSESSESSESAAPAQESSQSASESSESSSAPADSSESSATTTEEIEYETRQQKKVYNIPLVLTKDGADIKWMSAQDRTAARAILAKLNADDELRREIAAAKNELEAYIYATRDKLNEEDAVAVSTAEQRSELSSKLEAAGDWLYEQADDESAKFKSKLKELKALSDPIFYRAEEAKARPNAMNATSSLLNYTRSAIALIEKERPWVKNDSLKKLTDMVDELEKWYEVKLEEQSKKLAHENPAFTADQLYRKLRPITTMTSDLLKIKKPKEKAKPKAAANANGTATNGTATEESSSAGEGEQSDATETEDEASENTESSSNAENASESGSEEEHKHDDL